MHIWYAMLDLSLLVHVVYEKWLYTVFKYVQISIGLVFRSYYKVDSLESHRDIFFVGGAFHD